MSELPPQQLPNRTRGGKLLGPRSALALAAVAVMAVGLSVRFGLGHIWPGGAVIADLVGSVLYTVLWYLVLRFVFRNLRTWPAAAWALGISVGIELLQLTTFPALVAGVFAPGRLILGTTFNALDLMGYACGALIAALALGKVGLKGPRSRG